MGFWLGLVGIDTFEVLAIKYKIDGGKAVLALQFAGPEGIDEISAAGTEFIQPFQTFFGGISDGDEAAHALAYMDAVFIHLQGKSYFNFYSIIEATKFESEVLAKSLGEKSLQKMFKVMCEDMNTAVEEFARDAAPVVEDAREYVHEVTGYAGETEFDNWFVALHSEE